MTKNRKSENPYNTRENRKNKNNSIKKCNKEYIKKVNFSEEKYFIKVREKKERVQNGLRIIYIKKIDINIKN